MEYASQRECMRAMVRRYGKDKDKCIRGYAKAEMKGEVFRKRNKSGRTPWQYAFQLYHDMLAKGW